MAAAVLAVVGKTKEGQKEMGRPGFASRRRAVVEGGGTQKVLAVLYTHHLSANDARDGWDLHSNTTYLSDSYIDGQI